jgi:hypothetical protein
VNVNTWTFEYTIAVIEKDTGVDFDATNEVHVQKLKDMTWPYLYEQMNLLNYAGGLYGTWFGMTMWFLLCPTMFVDEDGYALDGFPLMLAKTNQLSAMYWGDYSWLEDPYNRKIPLEVTTFLGTLFNVSSGYFIYVFQFYILGDIPAIISIFYQVYFTFLG